MVNVRRINLYGGPGSGKSTLAAYLYGTFKMRHYNIELVREHVKNWVYEGKKVEGFDQVCIFTEQLKSEYLLLRNNIDLIITDSPLYMAYFYTIYNNHKGRNEILQLAKSFEQEYKSLNVWINRGKMFSSVGRWHDMEESINIDIKMKTMLNELGVKFVEYNQSDLKSIRYYISSNV